MNILDAGTLCNRLLSEVERVIIGKSHVVEKIMLAVLCDGHVLIEDYPGLAKTLMAKTFAHAMGGTFKRVQFTPDLLPADITGTYVFNQKESDFELKKGPIFCNIFLADEINRSTPKTQSALLEAMQERQVTLDGITHPLEKPFIAIATQNPIELEGTFNLAEAQIDRFLMKINIGYPSQDEEKTILSHRISRMRDEFDTRQVVELSDTVRLQNFVESIHVEDDILQYVVEIVQATRNHENVEVGASPRASLALMKVCRALAFLKGRDFVTPDDVKYLAHDVLNHRLILRSESWVRGATVRAVIESILNRTEVPKVK